MARNSQTTAVKAAPVAEDPTATTAPETAVKSEPGGYAAWIGLDWADQKHDWSLCTAEGKRRQGQMKSTPEAIDLWAAALAQEFSGRPVAVALEQSRGSLTGMLCKYAHIVLIPVHSTAVSNYRKTFSPSGAKNDLRDSALILDLVMKHAERFRPQPPDTVATRSLQFLTEERRKLVDRQTGETQRLINWLKQIFPQILQWFDDVSIPMVGALLKRWPTLEKLQGAAPGTLEEFFRSHNSRSEEKIGERIGQIRLAVAATHDPAVLQTGGICVQNCIREMEQKREAIAVFDRLIAETFRQHPDRFIVESLPGAGPVLEPRLIAAVGSIRERFDSAQSMSRFAGIAPVEESSGKACWIHWRWSCPKFIRQTFHEWANCSIRFCDWAREFYDRKRAAGKGHHAAIRALAFKWIRIYYRCWRNRVPYVESIYLASLNKTVGQAILLDKTTAQTALAASSLELQIQWKKSAGFSKPAKVFA
jgi:hypothetical protein